MHVDFKSLGPPSDWELPSATLEEFQVRSHDFAILIPVLNEGDRIKVELDVLRKLSDKPDVIICDGGSTDGCTDSGLMADLGVTAMIRKTSPGKMSSQLRLLMAYALLKGYVGMVHMDGNNKDEPSCIADYLRYLKDGYDCVVGSRFRRGGQSINAPRYREMAIQLLHAPLMSLAARRRFTDTTNSFRGYSSRFIADPRVQPFRDIFVSYNLPYYLLVKSARLGFKMTEIPVIRRYPKGEVPSKIKGIRGNLGILGEVFEILTGAYDPKDKSAVNATVDHKGTAT